MLSNDLWMMMMILSVGLFSSLEFVESRTDVDLFVLGFCSVLTSSLVLITWLLTSLFLDCVAVHLLASIYCIGFDWLWLAWNFYCVKDYCQLVLWIGLDWLRFYFKYLLTWLWLGWEYLRDWLDSVGLALSYSYYNSFIKLDGIN